MLLGQEFREQASGMKGSSFITGHEPLERTKQLITLMVKTIFPKVCPEIYRKQRKDKMNCNACNEYETVSRELLCLNSCVSERNTVLYISAVK